MAQVTWTIRGSIRAGQLPTNLRNDNSSTAPLAGVTVKVYANEGIRWNSWGTVKTRSDGTFFMTKRKDRSRRKFRIEVQFKNNNIVIYGENKSVLSKVLALHNHPINIFSSENIEVFEAMLDHVSRATYKSDFYELYEGRNRLAKGVRTLNRNIVITSSTAPNFEAGLAHKHAIMWHATDKLRTHMSTIGYPFSKKLAIKYPHNNKLINDNAESSYASPLNNCVYLCRNSQKDHLMDSSNLVELDALYHELMHLWAYNYSRGEDGMAWQLIKNQSTHDGLQNKSFVAFHESFAEFAARNLMRDIFGENNFPFESVPLSRAFLTSNGISESNLVDNHEEGWNHIFNTITCPNLEQYDLNGEEDKADLAFENIVDDVITLTFEDILETFNQPRPFKTNQMNRGGFMARVMGAVDGFSQEIRDAYIQLFDPTDTVNPLDAFNDTAPESARIQRPRRRLRRRRALRKRTS